MTRATAPALLLAVVLPMCSVDAGWTASPKPGRKGAAPQMVMPDLPWEQLDSLADEFEALKKESRPLLDQLRAMQADYANPADHDAMVASRAALRQRLQLVFEKLESVSDRFKEMQKVIQLQAVPLAFASINATNFQEASGKEMLKALQYDEIKKAQTDWSRALRQQMGEDQAAFDTAESLRAQRERSMMAVGGGVLALVVIVSLLVWGMRRRSADTVFPSVQPPAAMLSGPADASVSGPAAAQRLSGPVGAPLSGPASGPSRVSGPAGAVPALPAPADTPLPGVLNQNFRIEREIGRGGMGLVYEAMDLTLQRKVAIKRMRQELVESKKELDMFLSEARLVASLKHPNLVQILSIFREGGQLYLVFEYVSGKALQQYLEDGRRLPHRQTLDILRPVCQALDYAHSRKVIHRDLKPSNIMVTDERVVKVMDFGIAHQAKKTVAKLTRADAWGTPPYMAPEQELGTVSKESDLYSLGVCYYEMLTGELPFQGPNFLAQKREMIYTPAGKAAAGIPPEVDEVVRKALQADPRNRFHSGAELIAALEAVEKRPS